MTDKVQLIKEEIERRIENLKISLDKNCITEESKLDIRGNITTLYGLLEFIDSLPEEPASKDLEEAADKYAQQHSELLGFDCDCEPIQTGPELKKAVKFGAEWQKQQMMKDAVDCDVFKKEDNMAELRWNDYTAFKRLVSKFNGGDKVKLVIIKKD